jgi:hypothetical protein
MSEHKKYRAMSIASMKGIKNVSIGLNLPQKSMRRNTCKTSLSRNSNQHTMVIGIKEPLSLTTNWSAIVYLLVIAHTPCIPAATLTQSQKGCSERTFE